MSYSIIIGNSRLKGVFAKTERGMGLMRLKSAFDLLILLPSFASIRRKMLKTTTTTNNNNQF